MNEELTLRASPLLIITRILVLILLATAVVSGYFGFVDPRSEEQKAAEYKEELLSTTSAQNAIKAIKCAKRNADFAEITKVSRIKSNKQFFMVYGYDSAGNNIKVCYDAINKLSVDTFFYEDIYYSIQASNYYFNKEQEFEIIYEGEDLKILYEEANG